MRSLAAIPSTVQLVDLLRRSESGSVPAGELKWLAGIIDHTLLKPGASDEQHRALCTEARQYGFATVCVYPQRIQFCRELLRGSSVRPIAVVGFPTGLHTARAKCEEAASAVDAGAAEIDMVLHVEKLRSRKHRSVYLEIRKVVKACGRVPVKVILETCLLTDEEKTMACALAKAAGAAFVKTSTGFSTGGATPADVSLMRRSVGCKMGVKASGGIRTLSDALRLVIAGANRLGTSGGVALVSGKSSHGAQSGVY